MDDNNNKKDTIDMDIIQQEKSQHGNKVNTEQTTEGGNTQQDNCSVQKPIEKSTSTTEESQLDNDDDQVTDEMKNKLLKILHKKSLLLKQQQITSFVIAKKNENEVEDLLNPIQLTECEQISFKIFPESAYHTEENNKIDKEHEDANSISPDIPTTEELLEIMKYAEEGNDVIATSYSILLEDNSDNSIENLDELKIIAQAVIDWKKDSFFAILHIYFQKRGEIEERESTEYNDEFIKMIESNLGFNKK